MANPVEVQHEYKITSTNQIPNQKYDAVVLGVAHKEFLPLDIPSLQKEKSVLYDVKGILGSGVDGKL